MDPLATSLLFQQFLTQRRYLKNVTPSTIEWYETAFKALQDLSAQTRRSRNPRCKRSSVPVHGDFQKTEEIVISPCT